MASARYVWELSQAALNDEPGFAIMLRIYMDESGTHDGSPVVTVGAYSGRPKTWKAFTQAWNVAKRPIDVFHSTDCEALQEEFKGWTEERRNEYVAPLLPVLSNHAIYGNAVAINLRDFKDALGEEFPLDRVLYSAYEVCFQSVIDHVLYQVEQNGMRDALAFFHECNDWQQQALDAFNHVKSRRARHASKMTITFAPKGRMVPLQAADVLAYEANKRFRDQDRPKRRSLQVMERGNRIAIVGVDKRNAKEVLSRLRTARSEISLLGKPVTWLRDE